jgi:hypothetical protein
LFGPGGGISLHPRAYGQQPFRTNTNAAGSGLRKPYRLLLALRSLLLHSLHLLLHLLHLLLQLRFLLLYLGLHANAPFKKAFAATLVAASHLLSLALVELQG